MTAAERALIGTAIWNEGEKFARLAEKIAAFLERHQDDPALGYRFLVVDDGSEDGTYERLRDVYPQFRWVRRERNQGAGAAVRTIYRAAEEEKCAIAVTIAGNGKDDPEEIPRLIQPILAGEQDLVQGSRYLQGGEHQGMPAYRVLATRWLHPRLLSLFTHARITDSTNGFRAVRVSMLSDPRFQFDQAWLDRYELEPYLLYQALHFGYRVTEVPVKKIYPERSQSYTKMKPFSGWWSILRPLFYLKLGLRK